VKVQVLDGITLFADGRPGGADGSDVDVNDIRQGGLGDCRFMAALAELARTRPAFLRSGINRVLGTPSDVYQFTVRFFGDNGEPFNQEVTFELDRGFDGAQLSGDFDAAGNVEIWPLVVERAYAEYMGGFGQINSGGTAQAPWKLLTGRDGRNEDVAAWTNADILALIQLELTTNGKLLFLASKDDASDIVPKHAFSIVRRSGTNPGWVLSNPWGREDVLLDGQLQANIDWIEIVDP
jgi:hypothetical protein